MGPSLWTVLAWVRRDIEQTLFGWTAPAAAQPVAASVVQSPNLLVNPGAEVGDPSLTGYSSVSMPGWAVTGTPTVIQYGTLRRLPGLFGTMGPTLPGCLGFPSHAPPGGGAQFFGGGNVATSTLSQTVDLTGAAAAIDGGAVPFTLSGDLGGYLFDPSRASVTVNFLDANHGWLGDGQIGPVTALERWLQTGLQTRTSTGTVPVGTRSAQVVVTFTDCNPVLGNYNNAYADDLSFTVGAALPAPAPPSPPTSTVGALDHVFMVYMENHGSTDIVGSPNAPYLNSLINAYGYGANYYALTHPSDPNYYPILGGSDFAINYNCPSDCFDQRNLADSIETANKTWAAYQVGGGGYSTPTDRTPFLAFHDIYDDADRVAAHIFDLSQLSTDLATPGGAPNFVWFAADEDHNMEGPIGTFDGLAQFVVSQLTTHQYNVKAGDEFLQQTVPIILDSPDWNDPTQSSAIFLTFDEDYNNISFGIGNQGNHVVMIVIPSPGAVNAGMRQGHFVVDDYNNHYSLLRTIEDSLGLPSLTANDEYAQPMNGYWV
ncbi:MAG: alkaline phosphatase family protein [Actinomycetota bacterium]|nr:alkaline phosphatase family protein [Actinomycetota bacterium]